jgi:hypothetical protein
MLKFYIVALVGSLASLLLVCTAAQPQDDRFAKCPDPEAARQYVKECLAANPYKTKEVCEELALEKLCKKQ